MLLCNTSLIYLDVAGLPNRPPLTKGQSSPLSPRAVSSAWAEIKSSDLRRVTGMSSSVQLPSVVGRARQGWDPSVPVSDSPIYAIFFLNYISNSLPMASGEVLATLQAGYFITCCPWGGGECKGGMGWEQGWAVRMGLVQLGLLYRGDWGYFCYSARNERF